MENADYLLLALASIAAALICFASPVFGWMWRGDWEWPGWTIGSLLRGRRSRSGFHVHATGPASNAIPEPSDPLAHYSVGWLFLALALALLAAAGLQAAMAG